MLRPTHLPALALLLAAGLSGCAATGTVGASAASEGGATLAAEVGTQEAEQGEDEAEEPEDAEAAAEKLAREIAKLEFKLEQARIDLQSSQIQSELDLGAGEQEVADAAVELQEAVMAFETYRELESKHALDTSQLSLDRATNRAMEAAQELAELQSMYDVEEFAEKTKELVISRGERNLAMTQRSLELQGRSHAHLEGWEVPKKIREHERKVAAAERKVARAQRKLAKTKLDVDKRMRAADHAIVELEQQLADKRDEVEA